MKNSIIIRFCILLLLFPACKKYEEGPSLSLQSKKTRLANTWKYEKILVNKIEKPLDPDDQKFRLTFEKEGLAVKEVANASGPASFAGNWFWQNDKEKLKTIFDYTYFGNPVHEVAEYEILRLKNKELWLEEIQAGGDTLQYYFIPE
jgi:hypothetical protein